MREIGWLATLMAVVAVVQPARAQPGSSAIGQAEQLFDDARALLKDQRYAEACDTFARSFAVGHIIGAELNLGDCAERTGRLVDAWHLFDAAALDWEREGDYDRSRHARASADRVATKLATIVVTLADPTIAGMTVQIGERDVPPAREVRELVEPADIEVVVTIPGRVPVRRTAHAHAGAIATIDIPAVESPTLEAMPPRREPAPGGRPASLVAPLAVGGGAVALAAAALGIWRWSADTNDRARSEPDDVLQHQLFRDANARYRVAQGVGVASVACAGVAVWLYVRNRTREPPANARTAGLTLAPVLTKERTLLLLEGRY